MAGILQWANDPANQGLLNLSAGLLQASGPSRTPVSLGQAFGQAVPQGMNAFQQAQQGQMQQQLFGLRMSEAQRQRAMDESRAAAMARLASDPRFAGMQDLLQVAPNAAIEQAFPKAPQPQLVDVPVPGKPGVTQKMWMLPGQSTGTAVGAPKLPEILNPDVQEAKRGIAAAGRPNVDVRVNSKMGEGLAGKVGDIATEGRSAAIGAVDIVDTVNRVSSALDKGNVNLGPTATIRNKADQFANVLGIGGATTEERLVNTRNVMRGLAQFTVAARKALKGQGQVSDYEGKLLSKAESGEIEDFTAPELKDFLKVTDRIARKAHAEHKRIIGVMGQSQDESVRGLVPYFDIPDLPEMPKPSESAPTIDFNNLPKRR